MAISSLALAGCAQGGRPNQASARTPPASTVAVATLPPTTSPRTARTSTTSSSTPATVATTTSSTTTTVAPTTAPSTVPPTSIAASAGPSLLAAAYRRLAATAIATENEILARYPSPLWSDAPAICGDLLEPEQSFVEQMNALLWPESLADDAAALVSLTQEAIDTLRECATGPGTQAAQEPLRTHLRELAAQSDVIEVRLDTALSAIG